MAMVGAPASSGSLNGQALPEPRGGRQRVLVGPALVGLTILLGYFAWETFLYVPPEADTSVSVPGEYFPSQGNRHLANGERFTGYNTNPPTSGPHWIGGAVYQTPAGQLVSVPPAWGVYDEELPKESLVHAMEHGGVVVWYNDRAGCGPSCSSALRQLVLRYVGRGRHVILVPYHGMSAAVALTAWTRLELLSTADVRAIQAFVAAHDRRYDPEGL